MLAPVGQSPTSKNDKCGTFIFNMDVQHVVSKLGVLHTLDTFPEGRVFVLPVKLDCYELQGLQFSNLSGVVAQLSDYGRIRRR